MLHSNFWTMWMLCLLGILGKLSVGSTAFPSPRINCGFLFGEFIPKDGNGFNQKSQTKDCDPRDEKVTKAHGSHPVGEHAGGFNKTDLPLDIGSRGKYTAETGSKNLNGLDFWQCLLKHIQIENQARPKSNGRTSVNMARFCYSDLFSRRNNRTGTTVEEGGIEEAEEELRRECLPLLFFIYPSLCNETRFCDNLNSSESLSQRFWVWNRKKKNQDDGSEAVIYIVVVLAFYSFGIVFMMANFIRQEQREIEETKLYKQYVKVARDRWLTSRGNMANRLALQALNTFNAVPQTTDDNKITFV